MHDAETSKALTASAISPGRWWMEWEALALAALVAIVYGSRVLDFPIQGEETRRGVIAREMLETGDWIVPRVQGVVRLSRPPLQNWLIACSSLVVGNVDAVAVRLPSIIATALTVLLIYGVGRGFLSRPAALSAGAAYATTFVVLKYGRLGETEAVFTLLVAASLLLWWHGRQQMWPPWFCWVIGFACAALGMLAKGLQAPVFFVAITGTWLVLSGQWREFFRPGYWIGAAAGLLIVAGWQVPFVLETSPAAGWEIYFGNVSERFTERRWLAVVAHLLGYPVEVFCGSMMPWSIFLLPFASRQFRATLGLLRPHVQFLALSCGVAFLLVWLPPGSRTRYYLPLFPCFALLMGVAFQRIVLTDSAELRRLWQVYRSILIAAAAVLGGSAAVITLLLPSSPFALTRYETTTFGMLCGTVCWWFMRSGTRRAADRLSAEVWVSAAFLGLAYAGPLLSIQSNRSENVAASVTALRQELPADCRLVSFGELMHPFLFHFNERVEVLKLPESAAEVPADVEYFAIHTYDTAPPSLPFNWEPVRLISCDRYRRAEPRDRIYIGRRMPSLAARDAAQNDVFK